MTDTSKPLDISTLSASRALDTMAMDQRLEQLADAERDQTALLLAARRRVATAQDEVDALEASIEGILTEREALERSWDRRNPKPTAFRTVHDIIPIGRAKAKPHETKDSEEKTR